MSTNPRCWVRNGEKDLNSYTLEPLECLPGPLTQPGPGLGCVCGTQRLRMLLLGVAAKNKATGSCVL